MLASLLPLFSSATTSRRMSSLNLSPKAIAFLSQNPYEFPKKPLPKNINLLSKIQLPPRRTQLFSPECFGREDESSDYDFYNEPRFATHIDDKAIEALTNFYSGRLPETSPTSDIGHLDLCSSWVSFLPHDYFPKICVGLGMSPAELAKNTQLTANIVQDLNSNPLLPFGDASFDAVIK